MGNGKILPIRHLDDLKRVCLPRELCKEIGLSAGDSVTVEAMPDRSIRIAPASVLVQYQQ